MNIIAIMSFIVVGICAASCMGKMADDLPGKTEVITRSIEDVLKQHAEELMSLPGVVGVGQGLCDNIPCIKVYISKSTPESESSVPTVLDGHKVSIEITGEIRAHPDN